MKILQLIAIVALPALSFGCTEQSVPLYPGIERLNEHGMPGQGSGLPPGESAPEERILPGSEAGEITEMLEKYAPNR